MSAWFRRFSGTEDESTIPDDDFPEYARAVEARAEIAAPKVTTILLAYGMNIDPDHEIGDRVGAGRLVGWRLDFVEGLATVDRSIDPQDFVPVGLYCVDQRELWKVDGREGVSTTPGREGLYRRITVGTGDGFSEDDGLRVDAWDAKMPTMVWPTAADVYQKVDHGQQMRYGTNAPGGGYLAMIRRGYESFGFDQSILLRAVERSLR